MDNSIENKLRNLAPSSLSEGGVMRMNETIDSLAGVDAEMPSRQRRWQKIAAVLALLAIPVFVISYQGRSVDASSVDLTPKENHARDSKMVVVHTSDHVDVSVEDGLIIPVSGEAAHYRYRYYIVDEAQMRDAQSGLVVTIRQPREEILTVPVTQF